VISTVVWRTSLVALSIAAVGCAGRGTVPPDVLPEPSNDLGSVTAASDATAVKRPEPVVPPQVAMLAGFMPNRSIGADVFRVTHPEYDGRGVLIGILDSGIDPSLPGLRTTTTGEQKVLDIRDFSGEGRIALEPLSADRGGTVTIGGRRMEGFGRVLGLATGPFYGGTFRELTLAAMPAADVNVNGSSADEFAVIVGRASDGWMVVTDADGDGSFADEDAVRDFAVAAETFRFRDATDADGPMSVAVNLREEEGAPVLDLVMDNSSHGTHVAGIAAGHGMFGVKGFNGVAPGAQLLGLKISNNARGGISVTGSMIRAMRHAAEFAERRGAPLILNLSYGIGNEREGAATIDSLIEEFALEYPGVLVVISAGNDGPGLSTLGLPGSAEQALTVCAVFPGVFAKAPVPGEEPARDVMGWWSARGGELAKPDVCGAGVAYSNVPLWRTGEEISGGTSMAAPQVAGAAALLQSAALQSGQAARAIDLKRALMVTAAPLGGNTVLDEGRGVVDVTAAYRWLSSAHQTGIYQVRALRPGTDERTTPAAYRRAGLASSGDTIQRFLVTSLVGQPAARLLLSSDAAWIRTPAAVEPGGGPITISLTYDATALAEPGAYVGTVSAKPATDTLAGPSFALLNTVIVPHALDEDFTQRGLLTPGALARFFFDVPARSGGLSVEVEVSKGDPDATLYLFEPDGQPHRGGSSAVAGTGRRRAVMNVAAEDVVPGVYEAVVVAPPVDAASYRLTASLPKVSVTSVGDGPRVTVRSNAATPLRTDVHARLLGAVRDVALGGVHAEAARTRVRVPRWAHTMVLDVALDQDTWQRLTDFGVTVFDSVGLKIADGPLDYRVGRHTVELDSASRDALVDVELFPAFARPTAGERWTADLRITFLATQPIELLPDSSSERTVVLYPSASAVVGFVLPAEPPSLPEGFTPLVEAEAQPESGPPSIRRAPVGS